MTARKIWPMILYCAVVSCLAFLLGRYGLEFMERLVR